MRLLILISTFNMMVYFKTFHHQVVNQQGFFMKCIILTLLQHLVCVCVCVCVCVFGGVSVEGGG